MQNLHVGDMISLSEAFCFSLQSVCSPSSYDQSHLSGLHAGVESKRGREQKMKVHQSFSKSLLHQKATNCLQRLLQCRFTLNSNSILTRRVANWTGSTDWCTEEEGSAQMCFTIHTHTRASLFVSLSVGLLEGYTKTTDWIFAKPGQRIDLSPGQDFRSRSR